jgi:hypothetical protein
MQRWIVIALAARAAGASAEERPDPAQPDAKVPALEYRSAFEGFRAYGEQKVAPWRESNQGVEEEKGER